MLPRIAADLQHGLTSNKLVGQRTSGFQAGLATGE
jgi:hypothetical protein